jgi:hypothetical protein
MMMGVDRSVMGGLYGPRASTLRLEMIGSSRIESSPLEDGLGTISYNPSVSKDPCSSNFLLSSGGGGGGFEVNQ